MKAVFADTFYFLALRNRRDPAHARAIAAWQAADQRIVTTEFVLLEQADALSQPPPREELRAVCALLAAGADCKVIPASSGLRRRGHSP